MAQPSQQFLDFLDELDAEDEMKSTKVVGRTSSGKPQTQSMLNSAQNAARAGQELEDEQNRPIQDKAASFMLGMAEGGTGSLADELGGATKFFQENPLAALGLINPVTLPATVTGAVMAPGSEQRRAQYGEMQDFAKESDPGLYGAGQLAGTGLQAIATAPAALNPATGGLGAARAGAATGAATGGIMGAAQGEGEDRLANAGLGAVVGGFVGGAGSKTVDKLASLISRIGIRPKQKFSVGPFEAYLNPPETNVPSVQSQLDELTRTYTVQPEQMVPSTPPLPVPEETLISDNLYPKIGEFGSEVNSPQARSLQQLVNEANTPVNFQPQGEVGTDLLNQMSAEDLNKNFPKISPDEELRGTEVLTRSTDNFRLGSPIPDESAIRNVPRISFEKTETPTTEAPMIRPLPEPEATATEAGQGTEDPAAFITRFSEGDPLAALRRETAQDWNPQMQQENADFLTFQKFLENDPAYQQFLALMQRNQKQVPSADFMSMANTGKNKASQARAIQRKEEGTYQKPKKESKAEKAYKPFKDKDKK